jgi:hypothetical protein
MEDDMSPTSKSELLVWDLELGETASEALAAPDEDDPRVNAAAAKRTRELGSEDLRPSEVTAPEHERNLRIRAAQAVRGRLRVH